MVHAEPRSPGGVIYVGNSRINLNSAIETAAKKRRSRRTKAFSARRCRHSPSLDWRQSAVVHNLVDLRFFELFVPSCGKSIPIILLFVFLSAPPRFRLNASSRFFPQGYVALVFLARYTVFLCRDESSVQLHHALQPSPWGTANSGGTHEGSIAGQWRGGRTLALVG